VYCFQRPEVIGRYFRDFTVQADKQLCPFGVVATRPFLSGDPPPPFFFKVIYWFVAGDPPRDVGETQVVLRRFMHRFLPFGSFLVFSNIHSSS